MCSFKERFEPLDCKITLQNDDLWRQFHKLETEMIITKSGRRMFPSLRVQIAGLDPAARYCVFLEMTPASNCRYKYAASGGWTAAGAEEAHSPHRLYLHPESPSTGEQWMSQPVSFGRMKLTNSPTPPAGHVVLASMHRYQPRIIVAKTSDPRFAMCAPTATVAFEETKFIAVTAYQNDKITKLKIDNNPFAKGFRVNGQSKCKRKRLPTEESEPDSSPKRTPPPQRAPSPKTDEDSSSTSPTSSPEAAYHHAYNNVGPMQYVPYRYPVLPMLNAGGYYGYYQCPQVQYCCAPSYQQYQSHWCPSSWKEAEHVEVAKPKKLTDFSIRAITGIS